MPPVIQTSWEEFVRCSNAMRFPTRAYVVAHSYPLTSGAKNHTDLTIEMLKFGIKNMEKLIEEKKETEESITRLYQSHCLVLHKHKDIEEMFRWVSQLQQYRVTLRLLQKGKEPPLVVMTQTDMQPEDKVEIKSEHENLTDVSGEQPAMVSYGTTVTDDIGMDAKAGVGGFLAAPVQIAAYTVLNGSHSDVVLDVWDLWSKNPAVRAKLRNYAYFRGSLGLKIAISGTPFHYGKVLVSYQPYRRRNSVIGGYDTMFLTTSAVRPGFINYLSQGPYSHVMDIRENRPCEMVIPFLGIKPTYRLFNSSGLAITGATSLDDFLDAGSLYIYTINQPGFVSTVPSDISIRVYAHVEDYELSMRTGTVMEVLTQSDEREVGPVEKFTSAAADVADAVSTVPFIEPFAVASGFVFRGIQKFASIFGWSTPVSLSEPMYTNPRPYMNGAQSVGSRTAKAISMDPKQELSIDPRFLGGEHDEMTITSISSRSSYLNTFLWNTDSPVQTPLQVYQVNPQLTTNAEGIGFEPWPNFLQPTAMAYAATPFQYWRGDIIFRFEVVASQYHRGKLRIVYEPNIPQYSAIIAGDLVDLNKQYTYILDLQEATVIEIRVKWASSRPWRRVPPFQDGVLMYGATPVIGEVFEEFSNGYLYVLPFTELQAPTAINDVEINTYVRCENLQVNFLSNTGPDSRRVEVQSDFEIVSSQADVQELTRVGADVTIVDINPSGADDQWISLNYFGERVVSFRSCLKRFMREYYVNDLIATQISTVLPIMPAATPPIGQSATFGTLFGYLRLAYLGVRGTIAKRAHYGGVYRMEPMHSVRVSMGAVGPVGAPPFSFALTEPVSSVVRGSVGFVPSTNGGIEFTLPYYSENPFSFSFAEDGIGTNPTGTMAREWPSTYIISSEFRTINGYELMVETAAGEDFGFYRYIGAPFYFAGTVV